MRTKEYIQEYQRKWREANKEKKQEYNKMYRQKHKERLKKQDAINGKKYRARNKESIKKRVAQWRKENREKTADYSRKWRERNPEKAKQITKDYLERNREKLCEEQKAFNRTAKGIYIRYKASAKKRSLGFALTQKLFFNLLQKDCHYCGVKNANGIDRYRNTVGYSVQNSVPCCTACNMMKKTLDPQDFIAHAIRIAEHQNN